MNQKKIPSPPGSAANQLHGQPKDKPQPNKPGIIQPKNLAPRPAQKFALLQPKMIVASQRESRPVAPPVYRPQPLPKVLQTKRTAGFQPVMESRRAPVSPPAYHPQPVPRVL